MDISSAKWTYQKNPYTYCRFPLEMAEDAGIPRELAALSGAGFHAKWRIPTTRLLTTRPRAIRARCNSLATSTSTLPSGSRRQRVLLKTSANSSVVRDRQPSTRKERLHLRRSASYPLLRPALEQTLHGLAPAAVSDAATHGGQQQLVVRRSRTRYSPSTAPRRSEYRSSTAIQLMQVSRVMLTGA